MSFFLVRKSDGCFDLPWLKLISMCTFTAIMGLEAVFEVFGKASVKVFGRIYRFKNIDIIEILIPRWPLENPPPVAGSKSPTLRQQNGCKLIQFLF